MKEYRVFGERIIVWCMVYKLKKHLYGLSNVGRQIWLKGTKLFKANGLTQYWETIASLGKLTKKGIFNG